MTMSTTSTITHEDTGADLRRIVIAGRLDSIGTNAVAPRLAELVAAPKKGVVVDLSAVEFLASPGIGVLISSAKTVKERGGRLVLVVGESSAVMMSLKSTGIDQLIPAFRNASDAGRAALA
jgi:anti-anti-sigma factor